MAHLGDVVVHLEDAVVQCQDMWWLFVRKCGQFLFCNRTLFSKKFQQVFCKIISQHQKLKYILLLAFPVVSKGAVLQDFPPPPPSSNFLLSGVIDL